MKEYSEPALEMQMFAMEDVLLTPSGGFDYGSSEEFEGPGIEL